MKVKDHFLSGETFEIKEIKPGVLKTMDLPQDLSGYYDSDRYISHHQDSRNLRTFVYRQVQKKNLGYKLKILQRFLPGKSKVLDYGCGAGEFLKFIENIYDAEGYEPSEAARASAKHKLKSATVYPTLPSDTHYDAITLWHVLEHIEDQEDKLGYLYRHLNDEGLLIIAVPNYNSYDAEYYQENWAAYDVPRHIYHFSQKGLRETLPQDKWELLDTLPLYFDAYYISMISEKYKKTPLFWLRGLLMGAISNFKARKTREYSSLIYVFKKKKKSDF
ncbi:MAG: class I SAM-dependent methyltransferase [Chryseobacterium sp.]|nr:MAG: class I SAM-dependent methyltransferase [Chryseobacterium sp.]